MDETQSMWWKRIVSLAKTATVVCAFLAFSLSMRQKEMDRFSEIKPLFEIDAPHVQSSIKIKNHGGLVYFVGIYPNESGDAVISTPRKYSALSSNANSEAIFKVSDQLKLIETEANKDKKSEGIVTYWRDVDLNAYEVTIVQRKDGYGYRIKHVPFSFRSSLYITMSSKSLDYILSSIFPKEWFSELDNSVIAQDKSEKKKMENVFDIDKYVFEKNNQFYIGKAR